jgi:predicted nucleic acid binding AN1-type Zn finger protein
MESTTNHYHEQTYKTNTTTTKLSSHTKTKLKMVDTVIKLGIAYSFYAVTYSMPNIAKLDQKIIALQKVICGLPKSHMWTSKKHSEYHNETTT